jgi:hypothetical protein
MKKGSIALAVVAVVLALVILAAFLINIASRDCNGNRDCPSNAYCGSDYECHEFPDQIVVEKQSFLWGGIVLGISIITAAYILKRKF